MTYWFKPYTHWHEVSKEAYDILKQAGYGPEHLKEE